MRNYRSALCGLATLLFVCQFSFGQANVNENLETAHIYVDGSERIGLEFRLAVESSEDHRRRGFHGGDE